MLPLIMIALFISGCAGNQKELLAQDYMRMTNNDLLKYYYQLSDEIETCARDSNRTSIGLGTGFGIASWLGLGLGVSQGIPTCNPDKLRQRRIDVRLELNRRGLNP